MKIITALFHPPRTTSKKQFMWLNSRAETALCIIIAITAIRLYLNGIGNRVTLLFIGALLSVFILFTVTFSTRWPGRKIKKWCTGIFCYIPYLFGLYLFFGEGFWRLTLMLQEFSWFELMSALVCFLMGHMVASAGYISIEYIRDIKHGRSPMFSHTAS
ncbi:hypothetical protein CI610_00798 [invertebrate metagenome]|uniref:Uncharacterized protein n=1 Tax=invertebrate metagenome TaxID=1711999 RepID=A0A2H9TAG0_9ZZZZ